MPVKSVDVNNDNAPSPITPPTGFSAVRGMVETDFAALFGHFKADSRALAFNCLSEEK